MVSSNHMKLLSKIRLHGSANNNEVNKSEEFDDKHYFVGSFYFTGVSGSCVICIRLHMLFLVVFVLVSFFPFLFLLAFLTLFWPINNTKYQSEE